jgi:hypothetical protein
MKCSVTEKSIAEVSRSGAAEERRPASWRIRAMPPLAGKR